MEGPANFPPAPSAEYSLTIKLTTEYLLVSNAKKKYVSLSKYFLTWMAVMLLQEDWHDVRVPVDEGGDEVIRWT